MPNFLHRVLQHERPHFDCTPKWFTGFIKSFKYTCRIFLIKDFHSTVFLWKPLKPFMNKFILYTNLLFRKFRQFFGHFESFIFLLRKSFPIKYKQLTNYIVSAIIPFKDIPIFVYQIIVLLNIFIELVLHINTHYFISSIVEINNLCRL